MPRLPTISEVEASGKPVPAPGRVSSRVVVLLVALLVAVGLAGLLLGWRLSASGEFGAGEQSLWPRHLGVADGAERRERAVERLLDRRETALGERDRSAYLATVDPARPAVRRREATTFDRLAALPVEAWDLRLESEPRPVRSADGGQASPPTWAADVTVRHRLRGFDTGWASRRSSFALTRRSGRWYVARERLVSRGRPGGAGTAVVDRGTTPAKDLWQLRPVTVVRGTRSLVLGAGSRSELVPVAREVDEQVDKVSRVWGTTWSRRVVVLVPRTLKDMGTLLGAQTAGLRRIAAVTTGETDPSTGRSASRVVVNPAAFRRLAPVGREIVLAHEVTHVAARPATTRRVPTWLAEGLADYVAYRGTGLSAEVVAEELFDDVRAGQVPERLPAATDFRGTRRRLAQSYEMGWLACRYVADRYGPKTLLHLYRTTGSSGLDAALRETLDLSESRFTAQWQSYVARLAR